MAEIMMQTAFCIDRRDHVAVALEELLPGFVRLTGDIGADGPEAVDGLEVLEKIPMGHKVALKDIEEGELVIKYGIVIGKATKPVRKGTWVHLHCISSLYDERSGHMDTETGAPLDTPYE